MFLLVDLLTAPYTLDVVRTWVMALLAILASAVQLFLRVIV